MGSGGAGRAGCERVRQWARLAVDTLLPPRCAGCGVQVAADGGLCAGCWGAMTFIAPPYCAACGLPFEVEVQADALCGACLREPPAFSRARAALVYDDGCRDLILAFKHADRTDCAPVLARLLQQAGAALLGEADLLAPVPLHWTRLFSRRYNQSAMLALAVARGTGRPVVADLLVRRRRTPSQGGLGASARHSNVQGAFALRAGLRNMVRGRRVVLVDDVYTTGATVSACARVLRRAGAAGVDVLTVARVVRAT